MDIIPNFACLQTTLPRQKIAKQTVSMFENEVISDDNFNGTDKTVSRHCYAVLVQ